MDEIILQRVKSAEVFIFVPQIFHH